MCNVLHNGAVHLFRSEKVCNVLYVCESEVSEMKVCLHRCTMRKAHQELFNGTVEQLCPVIFLSENTELTSEFAVWCFSALPRSDRDVLVQHEAFGLPKPGRVPGA